jgi:hypothetical protein
MTEHVTDEQAAEWQRIAGRCAEFCATCGVERGQSHARGDCEGDGEVWALVKAVDALLRDRAEREKDAAALRAEVERLMVKLHETQEHIAYHLRDFRPAADMAATGDLAVDMCAFADRMRTRADQARADAAALRERVEALRMAAEVVILDAGDDATGPEPDPNLAELAYCLAALDAGGSDV